MCTRANTPQPEGQIVEGLDLDAGDLGFRFVDPGLGPEVLHDLPLIGHRLGAGSRRRRCEDGVAAVDRFPSDQADVVDAKEIVDRRLQFATILVLPPRLLVAASGARHRSGIRLGGLLPLPILARQLVGRHRPAVFLDQAAIAVLAWQARKYLEDFHRGVRDSALPSTFVCVARST